MKVKSEVAQLCPTLGDPMDCSLPGSSVHGIFQARVLEWGATPSHEHSEAHLPIPLEKLEHLERIVCLSRVLQGQPLVWESPDFLLSHRTTNPVYSPPPPAPSPEGEMPRQLSPAWEMGVEPDTEHDSAGPCLM